MAPTLMRARGREQESRESTRGHGTERESEPAATERNGSQGIARREDWASACWACRACGEDWRAASLGEQRAESSTTRRRGAARLRSAGERAASLRGLRSEERAFAAAAGWVWEGGEWGGD